MPIVSELHNEGTHIKQIRESTGLIKMAYCEGVVLFDGRPKPVGNTAANYSGGQVLLTWINNSLVADTIRIERKLDGETTYTLIATIAATEDSYFDTLSTIGTHTYRMLPQNTLGYYTGGYSALIRPANVTIAYPITTSPETHVFMEGDPIGSTKTSTLTSLNGWSSSIQFYDSLGNPTLAGKTPWLSYMPDTGNATSDTTITFTLNADNIFDYRYAIITFTNGATLDTASVRVDAFPTF